MKRFAPLGSQKQCCLTNGHKGQPLSCFEKQFLLLSLFYLVLACQSHLMALDGRTGHLDLPLSGVNLQWKMLNTSDLVSTTWIVRHQGGLQTRWGIFRRVSRLRQRHGGWRSYWIQNSSPAVNLKRRYISYGFVVCYNYYRILLCFLFFGCF